MLLARSVTSPGIMEGDASMPRFATALFCAFSTLAAAGCGADSSPTPQTAKPPAVADKSAVGSAYEALTAGAQDQVTEVIANVDEAVAKDPENGRAMFYAAIMRFWQLGEEIDLPSNPADLLTNAKTMIDDFRKAQAALPNDDRAPAFGGLAKVVIGNILSDSDMRAEGMSDIDHGLQIFPSYSYFLRALASAESPPGSDDFATVLPSLQGVLDACSTSKSSTGQYDYDNGPLPRALRVCNDDGIVPHVWEGFLINYGDLLLKAGRGADQARAAYQAATQAPRFDKWPFASALQDRIDQADSRAALYADGDPSNDPKIWMQDGHICTGCHQDIR
jgi:hypothetical protein